MQQALNQKNSNMGSPSPVNLTQGEIKGIVKSSWHKVAPFWPLKNLIAANPLAGYEDLPFEEAIHQTGAALFSAKNDGPMGQVNFETIKWVKAYLDEGQATVHMPLRDQGFLKAVLTLLPYDEQAFNQHPVMKDWVVGLPEYPLNIISKCLQFLKVPADCVEQFATLMLATLPGWASYIKYQNDWGQGQINDPSHPPIKQDEYLAFRLILACIKNVNAAAVLKRYYQLQEESDSFVNLQGMEEKESHYRQALLHEIIAQPLPPSKQPITQPKAQFIFCIDVRSEPMRRALESVGLYETYGFAGFFGVPVRVKDSLAKAAHDACPVLLKPAHNINVNSNIPSKCVRKHTRRQGAKALYDSLKYNFTTPFALAESLGLINGLRMLGRTFLPGLLSKQDQSTTVDYENIPFDDQVAYAAQALGAIGLTKNFAPLVVICGHGSTTQNNAFATALDCGACGGNKGGVNAQVLAGILNKANVREKLRGQGIIIPDTTYFLAAQHDTTTDHIDLFEVDVDEKLQGPVLALKEDLEKARHLNNAHRLKNLSLKKRHESPVKAAEKRSHDWSQVRPEWGLARNASFIIAPRALTKNINLQGRSFLHSYDYQQDPDGSTLTAILTAPVIVAQWINSQYLFSTLDNTLFGAGSKVTKNVVGKIGVMQGNSSDLMTGLPLQSVYVDDKTPYHEALRLTIVLYAPKDKATPVIKSHPLLTKLFSNQWIHLVAIDPKDHQSYRLMPTLEWQKESF